MVLMVVRFRVVQPSTDCDFSSGRFAEMNVQHLMKMLNTRLVKNRDKSQSEALDQ